MSVNGDWLQYRGGMERTASVDTSLRMPLELVWKKKMPGYALFEPFVLRDRIYLCAANRIVCADLHRGTDVWKYELGDLEPGNPMYRKGSPGKGQVLTDMAIDDSGEHLLSYSAAEQLWYCFGLTTMKLLWRSRLDTKSTQAVSPPLQVGNGMIWINRTLSTVHCVEVGSGERVWEREVPYDIYTLSSHGLRLYVSSTKGMLCLDIEDGSLLFEYPLGKSSYPIVLDGETAYVNVDKQGLYAVDLASKSVKWSHEVEHGFFTGCCLKDGILYIARMWAICAIDARDGSLIWQYPRERERRFTFRFSFPVVTNEHVVIGGGYRNKVCVFSRETGELVWEYETKDQVHCNPVVSNGMVIIGSHDKHYYCFGGKEAP